MALVAVPVLFVPTGEDAAGPSPNVQAVFVSGIFTQGARAGWCLRRPSPNSPAMWEWMRGEGTWDIGAPAMPPPDALVEPELLGLLSRLARTF